MDMNWFFTDGSKITIKNGTNGADGTTVIPEFRVEGNYWQVSTDKGATWVDVKDTEGNKVPARGQDGEAAGSKRVLGDSGRCGVHQDR